MWVNLTDLEGNIISVNMSLIVAVREEANAPERTTALWSTGTNGDGTLIFTVRESRLDIMRMVLSFDS